MLELYDSTRRNLVFVETTKSSITWDSATVNLQDVSHLTGAFNFFLQTEDTVQLHVEVWDHDGNKYPDFIRTINDLVIPFNDIIASDTWTTEKFTLSSPSGYLKIEIKISCDQYFGGLGCNSYCKPEEGNYTCTSLL